MKKAKLSLLFIAGILSIAACNAFSRSPSSLVSSNDLNSSSNIEDNSSLESSSLVNSSSETSISSEDSSSVSSSSSSSSSSSNSSSSSSSSVSNSSNSSVSSSASSSSSSITISVEPDPMWNLDFSLRGNAFRDKLESLINAKRKKTASYDDNKTIGPKAAEYQNSGKFVPFYHTTDTLVTYSQCNREHTWPDSRGAGKSGPGSDPFIIRPTISSENNSRGNNFYGTGTKEWDPSVCGFEGARGESARVILYAATAYHTSKGFELSNNPGDATTAKTMGTLKYLIEWNKKYPVTDMEKQINNYLYENGYGRNPFVDHPEYADFIWDEKGLVDAFSGGTTSSSNGGSSSGSSSTGDQVGTYNIYNDLESLQEESFAIVSTNDGTSYTAMRNVAISPNYPWYLQSTSLVMNSDLTKMQVVSSSEDLSFFKFTKQEDGSYTIYNNETRSYLYSYIDGSHYSIGLGSLPSDGGGYWNLMKNGNGFTILSKISVYLQRYTSWSGYKYAPNYPIYLFK